MYYLLAVQSNADSILTSVEFITYRKWVLPCSGIEEQKIAYTIVNKKLASENKNVNN